MFKENSRIHWHHNKELEDLDHNASALIAAPWINGDTGGMMA